MDKSDTKNKEVIVKEKIQGLHRLVIRRRRGYTKYLYLVEDDNGLWAWGRKEDAQVFEDRRRAEEIQGFIDFNTQLEGV
ncbi:MAG TPA: hypothetical protein ENH82_04190 [bacterium]|nr:hypothetical protein [bacterium]